VMGYVPVTVLDPTVMFMVELEVPDGESVEPKPTVTPVGIPEADNVIAEPSVPLTVPVMVDVPVPPCAIDTEEGVADRLKLAEVPLTVNDTVVVWVTPPPVPVTVMLYVPVAADEPTVMFMVELPDPPEIDNGLKPTVTPVGCPDADRETPEEKLPTGVLVIVELPEPPCAIDSEAGEADRVKLAVAAVPARAFSRPVPFGLPQPVARS
jgi:hypothetical protein